MTFVPPCLGRIGSGKHNHLHLSNDANGVVSMGANADLRQTMMISTRSIARNVGGNILHHNGDGVDNPATS